MMYAYTVQIFLTVVFGPAYRILYLVFPQKASNSSKNGSFSSLVREMRNVQTVFLASHGFFIAASAVASTVYLSQSPSIFEIAEIQALAFFQVNSILVLFFCLVKPIDRWITRLVLHTAVFILVIVVLGRSQLSTSKRRNWRLASHGCTHKSEEYGVITPVLYPPWAVAIIAVAGMVGFWIQSLKRNFGKTKAFWVFIFLWVSLIGLLTAGMILGLVMMWRQRFYLRSVAGDKFEDDLWGFGQVAALFVWAPIPIEILYVILGRLVPLLLYYCSLDGLLEMRSLDSHMQQLLSAPNRKYPRGAKNYS